MGTTFLFYGFSAATLFAALGTSIFVRVRTREKKLNVRGDWLSLNVQSPSKVSAKHFMRSHLSHSKLIKQDSKSRYKQLDQPLNNTWAEKMRALNGRKRTRYHAVGVHSNLSSIEYLATDPNSPLSEPLRALLTTGLMYLSLYDLLN